MSHGSFFGFQAAIREGVSMPLAGGSGSVAVNFIDVFLPGGTGGLPSVIEIDGELYTLGQDGGNTVYLRLSDKAIFNVNYVDRGFFFDPRIVNAVTPDAIKGKPLSVWSKIQDNAVAGTNEPWGLTMHWFQYRWLIAEVLISNGDDETYSVPLLDENGDSLIATELPPMTQARTSSAHANSTTADHVGELWTTGTLWFDVNTAIRPTTVIASGTTGVYWRLRLKDDPIPHWVIDVNGFQNGGTALYETVRFDLFGTGASTLDTSYSVGTTGTPGHYSLRTPWPRPTTLDSGITVADLNRVRYALGAIDVTNDRSLPNQFLYLTTGGTPGLVTGTNIWTNELPAVFVLAEEADGAGSLKAASAETTWKPSSLGGRWRTGFYGPGSDLNPRYRWDTVLSYDTANARVRLNCFNSGNAGGPTQDPNLDRTLYAYAIGYGN